jgi:dipeptidyl aminopeptidase/acylaminoacyl peptidase
VSDPALDVDSILTDPLTLAPAGAAVGGASQPVTWFDAALAKRVGALERSFRGQRVAIASRSADGMRVIATVDSPSRPPVHYLVDFAKGGADIVGESYPQLAQAALGDVSVFEYKARDDYPLVAYLTLPPGREAQKLPLVVLPHGGPESRDDHAFDWLAQFLATRGYAVVQPQFRGSTGFGEAHRLAGYRQWGKRMQDDVSDAVAALVGKGIADAGKTCIVGWSYGGYSALAGAAFTPELYACAASIAGVSDLPTMVGQERADGGDESNAVNYWKDHIGSQYDEAVIAASPARAAGNVRAPVLLLHGKSDTVVPVIQSRLMDQALRKAGKTVTLVEIDGEDHYMSMSETRVRMLRELEAFLAKYL